MKKLLSINYIVFIFLTLFPIFFQSHFGNAKIFTKTDRGTCGPAILKMPIGARAIGLGEAYVGLADEVSALYWNPAGLNQIKKRELMFMHSVWFDNIYYDFVGCIHPVWWKDERVSFGASLSCLSMNNFELIEDGERIGDTQPYESVLNISYSQPLGPFFAGANLKVIQQEVNIKKARALALDFGLLYKTLEERFSWGAAVQNLGTPMRFIQETNNLPLVVRFGGSCKLAPLLFSLEIDAPIDNQINEHFGIEYLFSGIKGVEIAGRIGYKTISINDLGYLSGLSMGLGFDKEALRFNYAFTPYGGLGNTHRFDFGYAFGKILGKEHDLETRYQKAKTCFDQGKLIKARAELENLIKTAPKYTRAKSLLEKVDERFRESIDLENLFNQGYYYYQKGSYKDAADFLRKLLYLSPHHEEGKKYLALSEEELKKAELEKIRKEIKEKKTRAVKAHSERGMAFYKIKDWEKAINEWEAVLKLEPTVTEAKVQIGKCKGEIYDQAVDLYKKGKLEEALPLLSRVQKYDPKYKETEKYLQKINEEITAKNQAMSKEYYSQGIIEYTEGNLPKARELLIEALKLNPGDQKIERALERVEEEIRRTEK